MVGHGGSSASSYLADPTSPIPSHCASVATSTLRVNIFKKLPVAEKGGGDTVKVEKKPAKKGKELRVLDPKTGQNLCKYDI